MAGSLNQTTQDLRVSNKTVATIDLTAVIAARNHSDPEVREKATALVNQVYQSQSECDSLTETLKGETLANLESKHIDALMLKQTLESELTTLNLKSYEYQAESGRISGRIQVAKNRLSDHLGTKKSLIPALLLPATKQAWEDKRNELQSKLDSARQQMAELQIEVGCFQEDQSKLTNRIRTGTADAIYLYGRIERLKGNKEPIIDRGTGLAI